MNDNEQQVLQLRPEAALALLIERVQHMLTTYEGRIAIGLAGGPGVGKSTLAVKLVEALNATTPDLAAYVPRLSSLACRIPSRARRSPSSSPG